MLEPQSTGLFVLLMVSFGVLAWWMVTTRQPALRVLAACLAFLPAMMFGVVAVNKYYGYYQTWSAAIADLTNQGGNTAPQLPDRNLKSATPALDGSSVNLKQAQVSGYTLRLAVTGQQSHITRTVYVYLPPQYFWPSYRAYRFPVIELIHGQPGKPQDWLNVLDVQGTLDRLMSRHLARPVVLVMPDANGAVNISLQCLNQVGGPQDMTYLAVDLPRNIARTLRVQPPGPAWGVAGYSEGGFCAANMALQFRGQYGFAGVLSGYFRPFDNQLAHPGRLVDPFGGSVALRQQNTPLDELQLLYPAGPMPRFWLATGTKQWGDVANADVFGRELRARGVPAPLHLTWGGGHNMGTWRAELPGLLMWMTPQLARAGQQHADASRKAPALAAQQAHSRAHQGPGSAG